MKKILKIFSVPIIACALWGAVTFASDEQNIFIPSSENVSTDLITVKRVVDVGANVNGDAILGGADVNFSGNATGDILAAGENVRVKGNSGADVRIVGGNVTLDGNVGKNVTIAGGSVLIDEDSVIDGNLYIVGGKVELRGTVKGNTTVYGSATSFSGKVEGNADIRSNEIMMRDDAHVNGNLTYASGTEFSPKKETVGGSITKAEMPNYGGYAPENNKDDTSGAGIKIWQFLSLFIVGTVFFKLFRRQSKELIAPIGKEEVWNRIASGIIFFLLNLVVIFVTFVTLIGVPLALMILFVYIILLIAASTLSPVLVGRLFNGRFKLYAEEDKNLWIDFVAGFLLMQIVGLIPVAGDILLALLFLFSFGRINNYIVGAIKANK